MVKEHKNRDGIIIHPKEDYEGMRKAGRMAAAALDMITPFVIPGAVTAELDKKLEEFTTANGAISATIGYKGYQHASCISINEVVCHGIPRFDRRLKHGDIVNIDYTCIVDGWYGDTSRTYIVGEVTQKSKMADFELKKRLVDVTYDAMMRGIEAVKPGNTYGDIGHAIQSYAESQNFSVVRDFCGHGLGRNFHEHQVVHFGEPGDGAILEPGMFFTIEPMVNAGHWSTKVLADGWTAVTKDGLPSAQFEHSLAVTETGFEIFTLSPAGYTKPPYAA